MSRWGQFVLACVGFAAVLIIFVHPLFLPPVSTPAKAQVLYFFGAILAISLGFLPAMQTLPSLHASIDDVDARPEDERLSLICTLLC